MSIVDTLISQAQGFAAGTVSQATSAMNAASLAVTNIGYSMVSYNPVALPAAPVMDTLTRPTIDSATLDLPSDPGTAPNVQDIVLGDSGAVPVLSAVSPALNFPVRPVSAAAFTETPPSITTTFAFPDPPSILTDPLGAMPTVTDRAEPQAPTTNLPAFNAVAPTNDTTVPTGLDLMFSNAYSGASTTMTGAINGYVDAQLVKYNPQYAAQMDAIEKQLTKYLNGGTALYAPIEDQIYERAKAKTNAEALRVRDQAINDMASRGFTLPNGALVSAIQQARQGGADNNSAAARDIAIAQAEMEQKNLQFAVTTSAGLRTALLNSTMMYMQNLNSINAQAIEYARNVLANIIETYNASVKAFGLKLDLYRTEVTVFDARLKAAMAGIDLYRAQIAALEALTVVDKTKVDVYRARIDSLNSYANVYKAQIDAVLGRASLEKMKLDLFQAKVQAYSAQVQAKNAEYQGYSAAIEGENSKVRAYGTQVQAYVSQVEGYKALVQARATEVQAKATSNKAQLDQFAARLDAYKATVAAKGEVARTKLENERTKLVAFQAEAQAQTTSYAAQTEYYKATSMIGIENARLTIQTMLASAENQRKYGESLASLSESNAKTYAALASSAMAGMNTLAASNQTVTG